MVVLVKIGIYLVAVFKVLLNSNDILEVNCRDFEYLDIGLLSVGPDFAVEFNCTGYNGSFDGPTELLNQKLNDNDILDIFYLKENLKEHLLRDGLLKASNYKNTHNESNSRLLIIEITPETSFAVSAVNSSTLTVGCFWRKEVVTCRFTIGNSDYKDNEQWMQTTLEEDRRISVQVAEKKKI